MNSYFESFLVAESSENPAERGLTPGQSVYLFPNLNANAEIAGTATLSDESTLGNITFRYTLKKPRPSVIRRALLRGYPLIAYLRAVQGPPSSSPLRRS